MSEKNISDNAILSEDMQGEIFTAAMAIIISRMLEEEIIQDEDLSNTLALWDKALKNTHFIQDSMGVISITSGLEKTIQESIANNQKTTAIILIATVIEHRLNSFYRIYLSNYTILSEEEISDVIRNSLSAKLGWLFKLVVEREIPENVSKEIRLIAELRNAIVHYKAIPSEVMGLYIKPGSLLDRIEGIDIAKLALILTKLQVFLDGILDELDPIGKKAHEAAKQIATIRKALSNPLVQDIINDAINKMQDAQINKDGLINSDL